MIEFLAENLSGSWREFCYFGEYNWILVASGSCSCLLWKWTIEEWDWSAWAFPIRASVIMFTYRLREVESPMSSSLDFCKRFLKCHTMRDIRRYARLALRTIILLFQSPNVHSRYGSFQWWIRAAKRVWIVSGSTDCIGQKSGETWIIVSMRLCGWWIPPHAQTTLTS